MATYTPLPVSAVDDPLTAELVNALRENPLAIAEGAASAPRIEDAALSGSVTGIGQAWVAARVTSTSWNYLGRYVLCLSTTGQGGPGDVVSGSLLVPASVDGAQPSPQITLPGSWQRCGYQQNYDVGNPSQSTTLFMRVA